VCSFEERHCEKLAFKVSARTGAKMVVILAIRFAFVDGRDFQHGTFNVAIEERVGLAWKA